MMSRKKFTAFAAAFIMLLEAVPLSAYANTTEKVTNVRLNKPYIGLRAVKGDDTDISNMKFALKNSKGEVVARFTGSDGSVVTYGNACDLTGITNATSFKQKKLPLDKIMDKFYPESFKCTSPSKVTKNGAQYHIDPEEGCYLSPADVLVMDYTDQTKFKVVDRMTVPANTIIADTAKTFKNTNNKYEYFYLDPASSYSQNTPLTPKNAFYPLEHAGEKVALSASTGKYSITYSGVTGGESCEVFDSKVTYTKVKMKFNDAFPGIADSDLIITDNAGLSSDPVIVKYDLRGSCDRGNGYYAQVSNICCSGSVISVVTPDENGYVEFWVRDDKLEAVFSYTLSFRLKLNGEITSGAGGGGRYYASLPRVAEKINVLMSFPKTGYCIGGLVPDKYTVVIDDRIDSRDYQISGNQINVTDSKVLQTADIKISKKPLLLGDCNRDGIINVTDIAIIAAHVKSVKKLDGRGPLTADVNSSGAINITDISVISAHVKAKKYIPKKWI